MLMLHEVGMTSREACYNTVRNVTACPYAGLTQHDDKDLITSLVLDGKDPDPGKVRQLVREQGGCGG